MSWKRIPQTKFHLYPIFRKTIKLIFRLLGTKLVFHSELKELKKGMMADFELHDRVFEIITEKLNINSNARILILGAGKGVFEKRLLNVGFRDITSVDINYDNYDHELPTNFILADLNKEWVWAQNEQYDLVIAMEVIEHLENPLQFLREINRVLKKNGMAIVSSPNPLEVASIGKLITISCPSFFCESELADGHITPIFPHIMRHLVSLSGLRLLFEDYNRKSFEYWVTYSKKDLVYYFVLRILSFFVRLLTIRNKFDKIGVIKIYVLTKP